MQTRLIKKTGALLVVAAISSGGLLAAPLDFKLPAELAKLKSSPLPGHDLALAKCGICHSADYISFQPPGLNLSQWTAEVSKMKHTYGAPLGDDEVIQIGAYLAVAYGSSKSDDRDVIAASDSGPATAKSPGDAQDLLVRNGCLGCHSVSARIVGPAYRDVAGKYRTDPLAKSKLEGSIRNGTSGKWGPASMPPFASLDESQIKVLVDFILGQ